MNLRKDHYRSNFGGRGAPSSSFIGWLAGSLESASLCGQLVVAATHTIRTRVPGFLAGRLRGARASFARFKEPRFGRPV